MCGEEETLAGVSGAVYRYMRGGVVEYNTVRVAEIRRREEILFVGDTGGVLVTT